MSKRYPGGIITKSPATPTGPFETGTAPGIWTLEQQMQFKQQGIWPLAGNAAPYIEDVFSTYLYTSDGTTQTITNGIDLSTNGGLVWIKNRSAAQNHYLSTTTLGIQNTLTSNNTGGLGVGSDIVHTVTTTGFTAPYNFTIGENLASWTFREQPKFFDIVTWSGNNTARTIAHNLGSVPGCIIVKKTTFTGDWIVYHRSTGNTDFTMLNSTSASGAGANIWNNTSPTSAVFTVGSDSSVNASGQDYVAYVFAHDAGGFGLTGTDNVISCGSYTGNGVTTGPTVTLGYEPQLLIVKKASDTADWLIYDNMRNSGSWGTRLNPNLPNAENSNAQAQFDITATGFFSNSLNNSSNSSTNTSGATYIYIAVRRGPMKVPTVGTSVFALGGTASSTLTTSFPVDAFIQNSLTSSAANSRFASRLQGSDTRLVTSSTAAEAGDNGDSQFNGASYTVVGAGSGIVYGYGRAPGFFDEVCYTGTGSATTFNHNLTVAPEMMILKRRSGSADWPVYHVAMGATKYTFLDGSTELTSSTYWNNTTPTSSVFTVGTNYRVNNAADTYVAYLFATLAGVSKVGSYTGTGALQTVNCGFTTGTRFVLIHRIDSGSNDWFVYDSARGIVAGNYPYLLLNSTAAQVTGTNYIDTDTTGFKVTAAAPAALNASGGTYIFLAIA
jgi:hypothetical protein